MYFCSGNAAWLWQNNEVHPNDDGGIGLKLQAFSCQGFVLKGWVLDIHKKGINERINWLSELARRHSAEFSSTEVYLARKRYLAEHPTAIAVLKCMDGRINIPVATNTPMGIITPFRNIGGMFDLGWPYLGEVLTEYVRDNVQTGRRVLMVLTYHFSRKYKHLGCAGFNFDTAAAIEHTRFLQRQVEHVFGAGHGTVYPLICGFETDEETLVLHGTNGEILDASTLRPEDESQLPLLFARLFPDMPTQVRNDLLPLLSGNIAHISSIRATQRPLEIEHREWMICVGRGFDFLHTPNLALIIGPYSPELAAPVRTAASIIESNMRSGRIPSDGFLLLSSAPYNDIGMDRARAELKAHFFAQFAGNVIRQEYPELALKMNTQVGVLDWRSRELELITKQQQV